MQVLTYTLKPVFFRVPFGNVTKIKGREYSKSHPILVYYLVQQAKMWKLRAPK